MRQMIHSKSVRHPLVKNVIPLQRKTPRQVAHTRHFLVEVNGWQAKVPQRRTSFIDSHPRLTRRNQHSLACIKQISPGSKFLLSPTLHYQGYIPGRSMSRSVVRQSFSSTRFPLQNNIVKKKNNFSSGLTRRSFSPFLSPSLQIPPQAPFRAKIQTKTTLSKAPTTNQIVATTLLASPTTSLVSMRSCGSSSFRDYLSQQHEQIKAERGNTEEEKAYELISSKLAYLATSLQENLQETKFFSVRTIEGSAQLLQDTQTLFAKVPPSHLRIVDFKHVFMILQNIGDRYPRLNVCETLAEYLEMLEQPPLKTRDDIKSPQIRTFMFNLFLKTLHVPGQMQAKLLLEHYPNILSNPNYVEESLQQTQNATITFFALVQALLVQHNFILSKDLEEHLLAVLDHLNIKERDSQRLFHRIFFSYLQGLAVYHLSSFFFEYFLLNSKELDLAVEKSEYLKNDSLNFKK